MPVEDPTFHGLKASNWRAMFRAGLPEYTATQFAFTREAAELVRIAFGSAGPYVNDQERQPAYSVAVTLTPDLAVELARQIIKTYAQPQADRIISSGEL